MPAMQYFEVEQTRTVTVQANSAVDAARIANRVFELPPRSNDIPNVQVEGVYGYAVSPVVVESLNTRWRQF